MWSDEYIKHKKEYFYKQRKNPIGKFTEFVVRTYYRIYKACYANINNCCLSIEVNNHKIRYIIYEGFGEPDHEYNGVINDCKKHLTEMGYISVENLNGNDVIFIRAPLDFINTDEHKYYLEKYNITNNLINEENTIAQGNSISATNDIITSTAPVEEKLYLNVPFEEKDEAKSLGARWNPDCKKWYVNDKRKYHLFRKWANGSIIVLNHFYIIEGDRTCFRCGRETPVIGFALEDYLYFLDCEPDVFPDFEWHIGEINIASFIYSLPEKLLAYLKEKYNYYYDYSKFAGGSYYYANHCQSCGVLQGNNYIFGETDSPFWIETAEVAKRLRLHKILLRNDMAINADIGWGSNDYLIKDYAKVDTLGYYGDYLQINLG